ncbi:MAG: hypothetical protein J6A07_05035 [Firmicutes bacterium]|nr:hypothetical protein [Bacillota bacterium]
MKKKKTKQTVSIVLSILMLILGMPINAFADEEKEFIDHLDIGFKPPICSKYYDPTDKEAVELHCEDDEGMSMAEIVGEPRWVTNYETEEPFTVVPFEGNFIGGEKYTLFMEIKTENGYKFGEDVEVEFCEQEYYDSYFCTPLLTKPDRLVVAFEFEAFHDWDEDKTETTPPTCISEGSETKYCRADASHIVTQTLEKDPDAHVWGEWEIVTPADPQHEGEKMRKCKLCSETETEAIPVYVMPYTKVYEPETSCVMSATIAWNADETAAETAGADVRPTVCFLWPDKDLNVYDKNGVLLSNDFDSYVKNLTKGMIPAFYINDKETAAALKTYIQHTGLGDCFVVSGEDNKALVKDIADLLHVRGMLDYSDKAELLHSDITDMIKSVNGAHGKTLIISEESATKENIRLMQSLAATVWVKTTGSTESIMRAYTRGANGIVTDDYEKAIECMEFFNDEAATLLRIPFVIGHRGDPSVCVENTLDSAKTAFAEGADSVENDIQLSKDGKLFILHDDTVNRLLNLGDELAESFTLDELRSHAFDWESIIALNEVSAAMSRDGKLMGQDEGKEYFVPTYEEYLAAFKGTGLIHDTEIKSNNPAIIPVFKKAVDDHDAWDQVFCITFNEDILNSIYNEYPEISIGALNFPIGGRLLTQFPEFSNYAEIENSDGPEEALKALYGDIDRWNATYNPSNYNYGDKTVEIGRHRGLTVWPWTYFEENDIAVDYLKGVTGMTTDAAWKFSELVTDISSENVTADDPADIEKPNAKKQSGEIVTLDDAELVKIEDIDSSNALMIWRYKADLLLNGQSFGDYYLYSEPFIFTNAQSENEFLIGDADCDNKITASDTAYILQKTLVSTFELPIQNKTDNWLKYIDADADTYITASDATLVLQKTLTSTFELPAENIGKR